tara:strand:- start:594 stop:785 length:192 start_codon:yes stop_codon:yes gene_type:complete
VKIYSYRIVEDIEQCGEYKFTVFNVLKEFSIFGFSIWYEVLNREPFQIRKESEVFLAEVKKKL